MPRLRLPAIAVAPLSVGLLLLVLLAIDNAGAQGNFEDADKANEYTDQQFDLRHTIPGEPGIDYPILSEVPKTSFICKGRHEGYYADVESRCQAFRICAHTARSAQGFGFLCPNGTIFNQQKFVCDWYRNVDCDQSEQYYDMNSESTVGTTQEMMERVRQMMEYPTKTISQVLQQQELNQRKQQPNKHQTLSKDLSRVSGVLDQPAVVANEKQPLRGEDIKSEALPAPIVPAEVNVPEEGDDIYVNSLGELSSDPGIQFDHTNAHIIAEYPREYHYQKQKNFAARVNAGLEVLEDTTAGSNEQMAPEYIKQIRNTKEEATQLDLVANINNLLEEVSTDLDPSVSGYQSMSPQKVKQPFRFLSRGFSMQANEKEAGKTHSSYVYNRPKQTPGTIRFTNFKSNSVQRGSSNQQQQQRVTKPATSSSSSSSSYQYVKPAAAAAPPLASLTIPPRPQQQQQQQQQQLPPLVLPTQPGIVIARAEGQRIAPSSANNIISSLVNQPQVKSNQANSYVALSDFLSTKFGGNSNNINNAGSVSIASPTTLQQQQQQLQPIEQQLQQQHQVVQQQHQIVQQQHQIVQQQRQPVKQQQQQQLNYITQRYQQPQKQSQHLQTLHQQQQQPQQQYQPHRQQQHHYHQQHHEQQRQQQHQQQHQHQHQHQQLQHQHQQLQHQQQHHQLQHPQQINYHTQFQQQPYQQQQLQHYQQQSARPSIQSIQQPYLTPNIFVPYQQQQQLLPLFPPLVTAAAAPTTVTANSALVVKANENGQQLDHLNIALPALPNGLIPSPTLQVAQKRNDVQIGQLQLTDSKGKAAQGQEVAFYAGRTSYQVPQSSVGRLPNDITHLRRLRQRRH